MSVVEHRFRHPQPEQQVDEEQVAEEQVAEEQVAEEQVDEDPADDVAAHAWALFDVLTSYERRDHLSDKFVDAMGLVIGTLNLKDATINMGNGTKSSFLKPREPKMETREAFLKVGSVIDEDIRVKDWYAAYSIRYHLSHSILYSERRSNDTWIQGPHPPREWGVRSNSRPGRSPPWVCYEVMCCRDEQEPHLKAILVDSLPFIEGRVSFGEMIVATGLIKRGRSDLYRNPTPPKNVSVTIFSMSGSNVRISQFWDEVGEYEKLFVAFGEIMKFPEGSEKNEQSRREWDLLLSWIAADTVKAEHVGA